MNWKCYLLSIVLFGAISCDDTNPFSMELLFENDELRSQISELRVYVLIPVSETGCEALINQTSHPSDHDFEIEIQLVIALPVEKAPPVLDIGEPANKIVFVEGKNQAEKIILVGCKEIAITETGPKSLSIEMNPPPERCAGPEECDDDLWCNGDEACQNGFCQVGQPQNCDDQDPCTQDLCDEANDRCDHPEVTEPPAQEGPVGDQSCSDGMDNDCDGNTDDMDTECKSCSGALECDDEDPCTQDSCDGGNCVNQAITIGCECGTPPDSMSLSCTDPVSLAQTDTSNCSATLVGGDNQGKAECLSCQAFQSPSLIDLSSFDDGASACDSNGWSLVAGTNCRSRLNVCDLGGGPQACCDNFNTICETSTFGQPVLRADVDIQCGGGDKQWKLTKQYSTQGYSNLELCFDLAQKGISVDSGILITAQDGQHVEETVFCLNAQPRMQDDDDFHAACLNLPAWSSDSQDLGLTFLVHTQAPNEIFYLDNVTLWGWPSDCLIQPNQLVEDNFNSCDVSAWQQSGSYVCLNQGCANQPSWQPGLAGDGGEFGLSRTVDLGDEAQEVIACMRLGTQGATVGDSVSVSYDIGNGLQMAWKLVGALFPETDCAEFCVNLTRFDSGIGQANMLTLQVDVNATGTILLYGIRLVGRPFCSVNSADISVGLPPVDAGGGVYDFDVVNTMGSPLTVDLKCRFDPAPTVTARAQVQFQP